MAAQEKPIFNKELYKHTYFTTVYSIAKKSEGKD